MRVKVRTGSRQSLSKFKSNKTTIDGITFDSKKEAKRFQELSLLQRAGHISNLERQKRFNLLPAQRDDDGNLLEHGVSYIADFVYNKDGDQVVEDVKSVVTKKQPDYIMKRKLMLFLHNIRVLEFI